MEMNDMWDTKGIKNPKVKRQIEALKETFGIYWDLTSEQQKIFDESTQRGTGGKLCQ